METYHLRIHSQEQRYLDYIKKFSFNAVVCFEDHDEEVQRSHLHAIITLRSGKGKLVKVQSWRNDFNKTFPELTGNAQYSLRKNDDTEANYRYVCKGKSKEELPNIVLKPLNFNVVDYHKQYWEINQNHITKKKNKSGSFTLSCYEKIKEKFPQYQFHNTQSDRMKAFDVIMSMLGEHSKTLDALIVKRILNGVMNKLDPVGTSHYIAQQLFTTDEYQYYS